MGGSRRQTRHMFSEEAEVSASGNKVSIEQKVRTTLLRAGHGRRRDGLYEAYRQAVSEGQDGWALLVRAFIYWLDQDYQLIDGSLRAALCELAPSDARAGYRHLCKLLLAHTLRRQVDVLLDESEEPHADRKALLRAARSSLSEAQAIYVQLQSARRVSPHVKALAAHSLGNLSILQLRMDLTTKKPQGQLRDRHIHTAWGLAQQYYEKAISLVNTYAPPYNRLAGLEYMRAGLGPLGVRPPSVRRQRLLLRHAVELADQAVAAARRDVPGGQVLTYAPPLSQRARALFHLRIREPEAARPDAWVNEITDALRDAVDCSPHDDSTRRDIEGFVDMVRRDLNQDEPWGPHSLLRIRLSYPVGATDAALKHYFGVQRPDTGGLDELVVLRRWSSYTPLLTQRGHETVGGGYLLQWQGHRVAIDPGVGFIRNVHELDCAAYDFSTLIMTHQHVDHCADLEPLLSLFKVRGEEAGGYGKKKVAVLYSKSGRQRWGSSLLRNDDVDERAVVAQSGQEGLIAQTSTDKGIYLTPTPLHGHRDAVDEAYRKGRGESVGRSPTGFGLAFRLVDDKREVRVGITSDTGYTDGAGARAGAGFGGCDAVVVHVSTVKDLDQRTTADKMVGLQGKLPAYFRTIGCPNQFYKKHLGFWGTVCFICDLAEERRAKRRRGSPPMIVLSEFGEEMLGSRLALLDEVQRRVCRLGPHGRAQAERVWLADVGTRVCLSTPGRAAVLCQCGGQACAKEATRTFELQTYHGDITMPHKGWLDRRIVHLCEQHSALMDEGRPGRWHVIGDFTHFSEIPRCACPGKGG